MGAKILTPLENNLLELNARKIYPRPEIKDLELMKSSAVPSIIIEFYELHDGIQFKWTSTENESIGGDINISKHIWLLSDDQSLIDQCDMDSQMDERLRHFRLWDVPTMNTMVGFYHNTETGFSKSLYFYTQGATFAKSIELDVEGYLTMAVEAAGFYYWQQVLIDIRTNSESPETKKFKEWMPKLFPDFSWDTFTELYESLRIEK